MILVDEPEELVQRPEWLAAEIRNRRIVYGDCDDAITLGLALATAVGIPCRLVAIRPAGSEEFQHVFGECLVRDRRRGVTGWQRIDATLDRRTWIAGAMDALIVPV
jgi:transglutaminase-like putative cysteine protease